MADQNQQTPDSQKSSQSGAGTPPPNLPVVPKPTSTTGQVPVPPPLNIPKPPLDSGRVPPPLPPKPSSQVSPITPPLQGRETLKSSIRTMNDDLGALKKGQTPAGVEIQKRPETGGTPMSAGTSPLSPRISAPPPSATLPKSVPPPPLGGSFRPITAPPAGKPPVKAPAPDPFAVPPISIPQQSRPFFSPTTLILALAFLAVIGFSVWFFIFYQPGAPDLSGQPTPLTTSTPLATPLPPLETVFSRVESVVIALSDNFYGDLETGVNAQGFAGGEVGLYKVGDPITSERYSLSKFSDGTLIGVPAQLISTVNDGDLYLTLMRKADNKISYGFIIRSQVSDSAAVALKNWEPTMSSSLNKLFLLDLSKAAFSGFKENNISYPGTNIHYRNFPNPNLTIDYAIAAAPNGERYLAIANSREHIFAIIERIQTIASEVIQGK